MNGNGNPDHFNGNLLTYLGVSLYLTIYKTVNDATRPHTYKVVPCARNPKTGTILYWCNRELCQVFCQNARKTLRWATFDFCYILDNIRVNSKTL